MTEREPAAEGRRARAPTAGWIFVGVAGLTFAAGWACVLSGVAALGAPVAPDWAVPTIGIGCAMLTAAAGALGWRANRLAEAVARSRQDYERLAATDSLTGALNYTAFMNVFEREFARGQRYGQALAVMRLDIDFFKRINDGYGHVVGDDALRAFVGELGQGLRSVDALGRLGGKDFAIVLPNTRGESALTLADRLRERVAGIVIQSPNQESVRFTTSIGVTGIAGSDTSAQQMLSRAETALYQAQANGRNRVELAAGDAAAGVIAAAPEAPAGND